MLVDQNGHLADYFELEIPNGEIAELSKNHPTLLNAFRRLRGITGFVSILGEDPRTQVFSRLNHVMRVVNIAGWLCDWLPYNDRESAILAAMLHDINRMPFAHNLEKHISFDQASDLPNYLQNHNIFPQSNVISAITAMLRKDANGPRLSRLIYAADVVTGFMEDPILAVTTLDMPVELIPKRVCEILGLDLASSNLKDSISDLHSLFHRNPCIYTLLLNDIVLDLSIAFIRSYARDDMLFVDLPEFQAIRDTIKNKFLVTRIYPLNNESVSKGSIIVSEVGLPLMAALRSEGYNPVTELQNMTDQHAVEAAYGRGLISDCRIYYPQLPDKWRA